MTGLVGTLISLAQGIARRISATVYLPGFDRDFYLSTNPDVAESRVDPLSHYREHGWKEARRPNRYFDLEAYLALNPDVDAAQIDPLQHFVEFGISEGRRGWNGLPGFDRNFYVSSCPESRANPVKHYLEVGWRRGLKPNRQFDAQTYLAANPGIVDPSMCPYLHFIYHNGFVSSQRSIEPAEASYLHLIGRRRFSDFIRRPQADC